MRIHENIRNYKNIISKNDYIQPQIAQVIYLSSGECVAIIKTVWLKVIQRSWKRLCQQRKEILNKRLQNKSIIYKEMNGEWPQECINYPSIIGMFWKKI